MLSTSDDTDLEEVRAISPDQRLENAGRNVELAVSSRLSLLKVVRMPPLRAYYRHRFARIGHGPTEAEDLLQEALIAVHTYRHTYDRSQPFTPWIHAIARYKFLDYLRRTKVSFKDIPMESAQELTATSEVAAVESGLDLERLMSSISSKARQAI